MKNPFKIGSYLPLLLLFAMLYPLSGSAQRVGGKLLCRIPKNGERFTVEAVSVAEPSDSAIWDFSDIKTLDRSRKIRVVAPHDTLFAAVSDQDQHTFQIANDTLYLLSRETRLTKERCRIALLAHEGGVISHSVYTSAGTYCGRMDFAESGVVEGRSTAGGTLILADDTIKGATMLRWQKTGTMICRCDTDTLALRHTENISLWFDKSHRYPILSVLTEKYEKDGVVSGTHESAYLFTPDAQDYALGKPDTQPRQETGKSDRGNYKDITDARLTDNGDGIDVDFRVCRDTDVEFVLSDTFGRVHSLSKGRYASDEAHHTVSIDVSGLNPGSYIVYLRTPAQTETLKFVKTH